MTHEIKILKHFADAVVSGVKTFEVRRNDRGYKVGDEIRFRAVDYVDGHIASPIKHEINEKRYKVTYVLEEFVGIPKGFCIFSIEEVREMINFEKWKDTILAITNHNDGFAVNNGVPCYCSELDCKECDLHGGCEKKRFEWLYAEYVEPEIDWSKVPIDTKIYVRDHEDEAWYTAHFAGYKKGKVYAFPNGRTSWTADIREGGVLPWNLAELAEE